jgi:hypothetical protein
MDSPETVLEMAQRHVAEAEVRISAIVTGHFGHRDRRPERRL